jgi:flagellar hook protein FlgE
MSFNTALSGLRAANQDLSVSGNNIANASTVGFKRSRAEFGDVYANSLVGGNNAAGSGVLVTDVAQQFTQGNISFTDNALDLAINGQGFFILSDGGATAYTRAGTMGLDESGYIVANGGARLQGYPATAQGVIQTGVLNDLQIQTQSLSPNLTQAIDVQLNVDSRETVPAIPAFDPTDPDSFNASTSVTVYDSLGNPHVMSQYFVKTANNTWDMNIQIDGNDVGTPTDTGIGGGSFSLASYQLSFNSDGNLANFSRRDFNAAGVFQGLTPVTSIQIDNWDPVNGAIGPVAPGNITDPATSSSFVLDLGTSTQFGAEFSVASVSQDGFAPGRLAGVEVSDTGVIFARYTNGEALNLGQVALANFDNAQGLTPLGDTSWGESFESGQPTVGEPQSGSLGSIQAGGLEESNVDLSEQLVRLIIAQRNYQANAKTIETADTVTQSIINLR